MESATVRADAEAAAFVERCHDALGQHTGGNPRPYLELWSPTTIYRREDGAWTVIHRHGDSLMTVEIDPEGRR
jgi:hypothetical protein